MFSQIQTNNNNQITFSASFGPGMRQFDMRRAGLNADAEKRLIDVAKTLCGSDDFCLRYGKDNRIELVYIPNINTKGMKQVVIASYNQLVSEKITLNRMKRIHNEWLKHNKQE